MKFEIKNGYIFSIKLEDADENVKEITIPDGVTHIMESDFFDFDELETIIMPDSVVYIDRYAFVNSCNLKNIRFSKNLTFVDNGAFENTKWLDEQNEDFVIINDNILYKYRGTERNVVIPECVKYISPFAFCDNKSVESITMSDNVLEIGYSAFDGCSKLKNIRLSENLKTIEEALFNECFDLKEITIPDSVTKIGYGAFHNCRSLEKVIFPENCIDIDPFAFKGKKLIKNSESGFIIFNELLYKYVGNQPDVIIPDNIKAICDYSFSHNKYIKSVVMPDNVIKIGEFAFNGCKNLKKIRLSENLTNIDKYTFLNCTSLESIEIPHSVKSIHHGAFEKCIKLNEVKIHGKPLVDEGAFRRTGLEFDWIINPEYDKFNLSYSDENKEFCFSFHSDGKSVNHTVNAIMPRKLEGYEVFRDIKTGKYGYKNKIGKIVIKPEYDIALPFNDNGFAVVITREEYMVIDVHGKIVINTTDFIRPDFMDKVAAIRHHLRCDGFVWGFINMNGNLIVDCIFEEVSDFIGGFAAAKKEGKWGLIRLNFKKRLIYV